MGKTRRRRLWHAAAEGERLIGKGHVLMCRTALKGQEHGAECKGAEAKPQSHRRKAQQLNDGQETRGDKRVACSTRTRKHAHARFWKACTRQEEDIRVARRPPVAARGLSARASAEARGRACSVRLRARRLAVKLRARPRGAELGPEEGGAGSIHWQGGGAGGGCAPGRGARPGQPALLAEAPGRLAEYVPNFLKLYWASAAGSAAWRKPRDHHSVVPAVRGSPTTCIVCATQSASPAVLRTRCACCHRGTRTRWRHERAMWPDK